MMHWILLSLLVIVVTGVAVWRLWFETYHFAEVDPGVLYRDGNRSVREFKTAIRKSQARTVVMLNDHEEVQRNPFRWEIEFCRQRGIRLVHIPIAAGERPNTEHIRQFLEVMDNQTNHPVLLHCAEGVRRTAMVVAAYQMSVMKYNPQEAKEAIVRWGRTWESLGDIRGFIDDYNPQDRSVGSEHVVFRPKRRNHQQLVGQE